MVHMATATMEIEAAVLAVVWLKKKPNEPKQENKDVKCLN